jgi:hypothetical protein
MVENTKRLRELVACPPTWYDSSGEDWVTTILELDWYHSLAQHTIDGDDLPFHPHEFEEYAADADAYERTHFVKNLEMRRPAAEKTFANRAGRLIGLRFMKPSEQKKHFNAVWSEGEALAESSKGTSYLFCDFESEKLERAFWEFLHLTFMEHLEEPDDYEEFVRPDGRLAKLPEAVLWNKFLNNASLRICLDAIRPIGATDGKPTSCLCFDIHFGTKIVHVYPVSEDEAKSIMAGCDLLRWRL